MTDAARPVDQNEKPPRRKPIPIPGRVSNAELQAEIDATEAVLAKAGYARKKPKS